MDNTAVTFLQEIGRLTFLDQFYLASLLFCTICLMRWTIFGSIVSALEDIAKELKEIKFALQKEK
jgi:hypothetical protein